MLYLVRFAETGRDAQVKYQTTRRDLLAAIHAAIPGAEIGESTGRLVVSAPEQAAESLARIHGIRSFSPCRRGRLDELTERIVEWVGDSLREARTFRVHIKRVGEHSFSSREMAARLGDLLARHFDHLQVDLADPDVTVGVEIRGDNCYVFDRVIAGADHQPAAPGGGGARRFLVDQMLGPLVGWLRILGFDATYAQDIPDCNVVRLAVHERRVIVTRDLELSRTPAVHAVYLSTATLEDQLEELAVALSLRIDPAAMFSRCSQCNGRVESVAKEDVIDRIPEVAVREYDEFTRCAACDKVYWKGGQYERILERLGRFVGA